MMNFLRVLIIEHSIQFLRKNIFQVWAPPGSIFFCMRKRIWKENAPKGKGSTRRPSPWETPSRICVIFTGGSPAFYADYLNLKIKRQSYLLGNRQKPVWHIPVKTTGHRGLGVSGGQGRAISPFPPDAPLGTFPARGKYLARWRNSPREITYLRVCRVNPGFP